MVVCRKCGYRNTPDKIERCNFCSEQFEEEKINRFRGDPIVDILTKYGHNVAIIKYNSKARECYIEISREQYNKYKDDFSVELNEITKEHGYSISGFDTNSGINIKLWFTKSGDKQQT